MKQITKKDLQKKMARTLRSRKVESIKLEVNPFDTMICTKTINFTNNDSLVLGYFDNTLHHYHFITADYKGDAYFVTRLDGGKYEHFRG